MKRKGISYDTGRFMAMNWRPRFDLRIVRRELEIIKNDLHANAVRICGQGIERLAAAAETALGLGLEVWLSPELWEKSPARTLDYIAQAAATAEKLRERWPEQLVMIIGSEFTLFMQGIVEGRNITARMRHPDLIARIKAGEHNKPLNEFLAKANAAARAAFKGKVTYASLVWEEVDWSLFDFVGVDHYRSARIEDKYVEMLKPSFAHGKPAIITEFGYGTCQEGIGGSAGFLGSAGLGGGIIDIKSQFFHFAIPVVGRFIRPRVRGNRVRDEAWQARKIVEQLKILDEAGVEGAFIFQFISQITPYNDDPRYDLDVASTSLVKYYEGGRRGATYPDMPWEPKEAFHAVADFYGGT
jgi:hypothetical protein